MGGKLLPGTSAALLQRLLKKKIKSKQKWGDAFAAGCFQIVVVLLSLPTVPVSVVENLLALECREVVLLQMTDLEENLVGK